MSEVIKNKYLDLAGLNMYDTLIKALIAKGDSDLAAAIAALDAKIGSLDIEGSDDKSIAESIANIYSSIADIVAAQDALEKKDGELEGAINGIIGDLESLGESNTLMTLVAVTNKLNELAASVTKNTEDITNVTGRVTAVEEAVKKLGDLGDGNTLGDLVSNITANTQAIETLTGEGDGSLKKVADAAAKAAQVAADASTAASEAKTAAEGAKTTAEGAATTANLAQATAGSALTNANEAKATAEGAATTAAGAAAVADDAAADAAAAKEVADDAAEVADEANEAAKTNASAITGLDERLAAVEGISNAAEVKYEDGFIKLYDKDGNAIGEGFSAADFVKTVCLKV